MMPIDLEQVSEIRVEIAETEPVSDESGQLWETRECVGKTYWMKDGSVWHESTQEITPLAESRWKQLK